jgi:hypothetical protein
MHEAAGAGFDTAVQAEVDGVATEAQLAQLEANKGLWQLALERLLDDTEETLRSVRAIPGEERDQIVADFEDERASIPARSSISPASRSPFRAARTATSPKSSVRSRCRPRGRWGGSSCGRPVPARSPRRRRSSASAC